MDNPQSSERAVNERAHDMCVALDARKFYNLVEAMLMADLRQRQLRAWTARAKELRDHAAADLTT